MKMKTATSLIVVATISSVATIVVAVSAKDLSDFVNEFDSHTRRLSDATSHDGKAGKEAKAAKAKGSKDGGSMRLLLTDFMNEFDNN
jgi:hypothetical protein